MRRSALLCVACFFAACGTRDAGAPRGSAGISRGAAPPAPVVSAPRDPPGCLHYQPSKSELRGTLTREMHYGPPNYGEDTLHDERRIVPILRLDSAIAVCGWRGQDSPEAESERNVREVQLVRLHPLLRPLPRTGEVVAYGELFHQVAGAHFTRVLLMVDSVRPVVPPRFAAVSTLTPVGLAQP
jgi:hypothetical protein